MDRTLEKYLAKLEKCLRQIEAVERVDIINEIKSEIKELEHKGCDAGQIMERLGKPEDLAGAYLPESMTKDRVIHVRKGELSTVLLWNFLAVVAIYLLFTPVVYLCDTNESTPIILIIVANVGRYLFIALAGLFISRKNKIELKSSIRLSVIFCALSGLSILLSFAGITGRMYGTFAGTLGIYDKLSNFSIILIEQLLDRHLITSFLICSTIVFFKPFDKRA